MQKNTRKKIAPVVIAILVVAYAAGLLGASEGWGVLPFLLLYAAMGGAVIVGVVAALVQRLREIDGGEEDEASKY